MKNHTIAKLILGSLFLTVLIAIANIITLVLLGYSGFAVINGKKSVITLQPGCQQGYIQARFGNSLGISLQVSFILSLGSMLWATLALFLVVCVTYCRRGRNEEREETRIEEFQSRFYDRSNEIERYHPRVTEIVALYLFLTLLALTTCLPFGFYLQLLVHSLKSTCQIACNFSQILTIAILTAGMLISSLISFGLLLILSYRQQMRAKMLQLQNGSESIGRQVDRIIREMPESQRRMYEEMRRQEEGATRKEAEKGQDGGSDEHRSEGIRVEEVPQVQSIIYKVEPELMLQSIEPKR